jgi:hypothetical protein
MSPIRSSLLLGAGDAAAGGFQVSRSLRYNSADSAYLNRTPSVAGNLRTWTWSGWVKISNATGLQFLIATPLATNTQIYFSDGFLVCGNQTYVVNSLALYRDPSAWYHIVIAMDTTNATAGDRIIAYINGSRITLVGSFPPQNTDFAFNSTVAHNIGARSGGFNFSGYLANIHFIDGQALTPSSFTEVSATTGQLIPKAYSGTYGTNGFYLQFADNSSNTASTLGKDTSGNSNNWTPNNLSVTAGAGNDSLVDSPTNYGTDTGVGGEVRGNYATWNPLKKSSADTFSNGNLDVVLGGSANATFIFGSVGITSGKFYWEVTVNSVSSGAYPGPGVCTDLNRATDLSGFSASDYLYLPSGNKQNTSSSTYGATFAGGDIIGVALDMTAGTITFYKNGVSQGQAFSGISGTAVPVVLGGVSVTISTNFGQRAFAYTAPSGFKALCTQNLPAPVVAKPNTLMDVVTYTGTGASRSITGVGFSPDFLWIKARSGSGYHHHVYDSVRGIDKFLRTSTTQSEFTVSPLDQITSLNADGFTLGSDSASPGALEVNELNRTYVGWLWDAGTSTVTNNSGSISSQVRANVTAGFSVATWSSGSGGTVGHGLGVAPSLIIAKARTGASSWIVYHSATGVGGYLYLSATNAVGTNIANVWSPVSSTVFNVDNGLFPTPYDYVSYHFAPVVGYSSFGSYTGNGSADGPFVYTGFRPKFVLIKGSSYVSNWNLLDGIRDSYNVADKILRPNLSAAEFSSISGGSGFAADFLSNGFKLRASLPDSNSSADTLVYAAFAENPFQYARAR